MGLDRADWIAPPAAPAASGAGAHPAWALLPTPAPLLLRTGPPPQNRPLAPQLGVQPAAIPEAPRRGAATTAQWRRLLNELQGP